jgi:tripartite-type tricarboxylate transporter receptor subunit TctC
MTTRRALLGSLAAGLALPALRSSAQESYPQRPINVICAFPPGSGADILVRFWANKLQPLAPTPVVVMNRPGAMASLAATMTARSKPDGYTILVHAGSSIAGNMHIFKDPPIDVVKELRVVCTLSRHSYMLVVKKDSPFQTLQDLTLHLKTRGERATYGSSNTPSYVIGQLYNLSAGLAVRHVAYRTSADFIPDVDQGALDFAVVDSIAAIALHNQGRWRMLAIGSGSRLQSTPDLPTFTEGGAPGIDLVTWWGAMVAAGTPEPVVAQINAWFTKAMQAPDTRDFLKAQGNDVYATSAAEAAGLLRKSEQEWERMVRDAKVEKV